MAPRDEWQQKRIFEFFHAAAPYRILYADDLALLGRNPANQICRLYFVEAQTACGTLTSPSRGPISICFEDDVNFLVKYADNPFLPQLRAAGMPQMESAVYGNHVRTPARPAYPFGLAQAVGAMEDRIRVALNDAANYASLGDLYLFEMNWITKAIGCYEKAEALAPNQLEYRWRFYLTFTSTTPVPPKCWQSSNFFQSICRTTGIHALGMSITKGSTSSAIQEILARSVF